MVASGQPADTLRVQRFHLRLRFSTAGMIADNWGPTLRGGFGLALRMISCPFGTRPCTDCAARDGCAYAYLFETPIPADSAVMRKYTEAPHPFIFEPPYPALPKVSAGQEVSIGLVLVGRAVDLFPYVFVALDQLGRSGLGRERVPFQMVEVIAEGGHCVWHHERCRRLQIPPFIELDLRPGASRVETFRLQLLSPTRVVVNGRLAESPELVDLVKNLSRRVFLLRYFHCGGSTTQISNDFITAAQATRCLERKLRWDDWERFSGRQKRRVPIGGVVGSMVLEGDFGLLQPLLTAGQFVHVGKNTSFGLGKFAVHQGAGP